MSYSIYFDKKRDRFILRQSIDGKRKYVSSHLTRRAAEKWKRALESSVDNYELGLIETDEPRIWKLLRKVFHRKAGRKRV